MDAQRLSPQFIQDCLLKCGWNEWVVVGQQSSRRHAMSGSARGFPVGNQAVNHLIEFEYSSEERVGLIRVALPRG